MTVQLTKRKIPLRKCIGCNESKPKKELIRIVRDPQGNINVDFTGKAQGRGAYICPDMQCFESVRKGKKLHKSFEMNVSDEMMEKLKADIKERVPDA